MAGTWTTLVNAPPASVDVMLLLTDGTVIAHQVSGSAWYRLTPTATGDYGAGTWSAIASMPSNSAISATIGGPGYGPKFFGSAVLKDGTVLVIGGEYNFGISCDMAAATLYDPVADSWTNLTTPTGWANVGDVPLCVMPDGRVFLGFINGTATAFFDPTTQTYTAGPNKSDRCAEESFVLLGDGTVLAVDCTSTPNAEKYVPSTNTWVSAGSTPSTLPQSCPGIVPEIGPSVVLPSGHVFVIGATGSTAIYSPPSSPSSPGTWTAGPTIMDASNATLHPIDAPAVLLPNGKVLLTASPSPPCSFPGPTTFLEYDPTANTLAIVGSPTNNGNACFTGRFILLPTGQVLFSNQGGTVTMYTPDLAPAAAWKPHITSFPSTAYTGHTYTLSGQQLNGLSQACMYGDDATMATNYPIVRVTNTTTGAVKYLRTANHSTMAIATGTTIVSTSVSIPASLASGTYSLVVVANGIPSDPVTVHITNKTKLEIKEIKEIKLEHKEIKEYKEPKDLKEFKLEHKEISKVEHPEKLIFEVPFPKELDNVLPGGAIGDPALRQVIGEMQARLSALESGAQLRSAIRPDERPAVGEAALQHSSHALMATSEAQRHYEKAIEVEKRSEVRHQHSSHPLDISKPK